MFNILSMLTQFMLYQGLFFFQFVDEDQYYNKIVDIIKTNGVVFVKLAQIFCSRNDVHRRVPPSLFKKIRTLQDKCYYANSDNHIEVPGMEYQSLPPIAAGSICNVHSVTYTGR